MKKYNLGLPKRGVSGFSYEIIEHGFEQERLENRQNLLDHFAGLAMQGFLAHYGSNVAWDSLSEMSYQVADAMLKARKEVETSTCGYCDSEFSKGTGGNYGEYGEVCANCYEGLS